MKLREPTKLHRKSGVWGHPAIGSGIESKTASAKSFAGVYIFYAEAGSMKSRARIR
jgi:hypothetical protein